MPYGYYPTNNIASIADLQTPSNTQNFNYDALQRLQTASGAYGSYQYGYDADSNRLSETQGTATTSYGYGAGSDLLSSTSVGGVTAESFGYTADGRLATLAPGIGSPAGPAVTALDYNQAGQYAAAMSGSTALAGYTYDGFGQRAAKTISATAGARYVYNQGGMLLEETNAAGVAQADYIYLNGQPVAVLNGSTLYDLHDDHLGTPQFATNASQVKEWTFAYAPFGDSATASGTITQNLRLPGQYYDAETGWNHNGFRDYVPNFGRYLQPDPLGMQGSARYYNPQTGRFLSEDPIGFVGSGTNLYRYAADSPTNLIDPFGLANLNLFNPQTSSANLELWELANGWNPSGVYSVAGHGIVDQYGNYLGLIEGTDGNNYTAQQLAQYIKNDPNWNHQPIDLRSCGAGKGANSFAQQLANALGVNVIAPTNTLYWGPSRFQLQNIFQRTNWLSSGDLTIPNGSWQTFSPVR